MSDDVENVLRGLSYKLVREVLVPTKVLGQAADEIERLRSELSAVRNAALEEAAKVAKDLLEGAPHAIPNAIRELKDR